MKSKRCININNQWRNNDIYNSMINKYLYLLYSILVVIFTTFRLLSENASGFILVILIHRAFTFMVELILIFVFVSNRTYSIGSRYTHVSQNYVKFVVNTYKYYNIMIELQISKPH